MQYTGIQLSAITSLALLASASDGECDDSEMRIIFGHLGAYVPDEDQRKDLIAVALTIPFAEATAVVRQMQYVVFLYTLFYFHLIINSCCSGSGFQPGGSFFRG